MRIVEIRETTVPLASSIRNAYIDFSRMTASVVAIVTDAKRDGARVVGYGFNSNGRYAQSGLLRERFIPRLLDAPATEIVDETGENLAPERIWDVLMTNEKPGGHGERSVAVGVLDMAIWDVVAKVAGKPLHRLLAERFLSDARADESVFVYAAGGYYYPDREVRSLQDEMRRYLDLGYCVVKMKIGGASLAEDLERIEAVLDVVGSGDRLAVDANGRFDLAEAQAYAEALRPYGLRWYEEPGDPLDFALHAALAEDYDAPMATGENLFSMQDAQNLIRYAGLRPDRDVLQFDPALSYGLVEYVRTLDMLRANGWSTRSVVPHGGHQLALAAAAGLQLGGNESYPGVFQPFGGFADGSAVEAGRIRPSEVPGIGIEEKQSLFAVFRELTG